MGDPLLYDLTLNTERLSIDACVEQVLVLARRPSSRRPTRRVRGLPTSRRSARAHGAARRCPHCRRAHHAGRDGATLRLRGIVEGETEKRAAAEVAKHVEGVGEVVNDLKTMRRR